MAHKPGFPRHGPNLPGRKHQPRTRPRASSAAEQRPTRTARRIRVLARDGEGAAKGPARRAGTPAPNLFNGLSSSQGIPASAGNVRTSHSHPRERPPGQSQSVYSCSRAVVFPTLLSILLG
jgi:hypothetical protein